MVSMILWIVGATAVAAGVLVPVILGASRHREVRSAKSAARSAYRRLGFHVETLGVGDDVVARRAWEDASERWRATGELLARATTAEECAAARATAMEGLKRIDDARRRLGLEAEGG
ncbi:hypothetical protein [Actinoalloteichus caeruleus]|uniref:hypothetical protein n=1 Tax=Actinoalloteichus cyanogriseus TaxID=2893586 RepID=UPI000689426B